MDGWMAPPLHNQLQNSLQNKARLLYFFQLLVLMLLSHKMAIHENSLSTTDLYKTCNLLKKFALSLLMNIITSIVQSIVQV